MVELNVCNSFDWVEHINYYNLSLTFMNKNNKRKNVLFGCN